MELLEAERILGDAIKYDGSLDYPNALYQYMFYLKGSEEVNIDGDFTAEQLKAIACYREHTK